MSSFSAVEIIPIRLVSKKLFLYILIVCKSVRYQGVKPDHID